MSNRTEVALLALLLLPVTLGAQTCPKGTEYRTYRNGLRINATFVWFTSDSVAAKVTGAEGEIPEQRWSGRVNAQGVLESLAMRVPPVYEPNWLVPSQDHRTTFANGFVTTVRTDAGKAPVTRRSPALAGTLPFVENIPLFLELILKRGLKLGGESAVIPIAWIDEDFLPVEEARIRRVGTDSIYLTTSRGTTKMSVTRTGSLVGAHLADISVNKHACVD